MPEAQSSRGCGETERGFLRKIFILIRCDCTAQLQTETVAFHREGLGLLPDAFLCKCAGSPEERNEVIIMIFIKMAAAVKLGIITYHSSIMFRFTEDSKDHSFCAWLIASALASGKGGILTPLFG